MSISKKCQIQANIGPAQQEQFANLVETCVGFNVRKTSRALSVLYDNAMRPTGLRSTQMVILLCLGKTGEITMSALADNIALEVSSLSRNLRPLEKKGFVLIRPSGRTRGKSVALTQAGFEKAEQAFPYWQAVQNKVLQAMTDIDWSDMRRQLQTISQAAKR